MSVTSHNDKSTVKTRGPNTHLSVFRFEDAVQEENIFSDKECSLLKEQNRPSQTAVTFSHEE